MKEDDIAAQTLWNWLGVDRFMHIRVETLVVDGGISIAVVPGDSSMCNATPDRVAARGYEVYNTHRRRLFTQPGEASDIKRTWQLARCDRLTVGNIIFIFSILAILAFYRLTRPAAVED